MAERTSSIRAVLEGFKQASTEREIKFRKNSSTELGIRAKMEGEDESM